MNVIIINLDNPEAITGKLMRCPVCHDAFQDSPINFNLDEQILKYKCGHQFNIRIKAQVMAVYIDD